MNQRFQLLDLGGGEWAIIAQRFRFVDFGGGEYAIAVQHSGKCLDVQAASLADTAPVVQYICHAGANQRFRLQ